MERPEGRCSSYSKRSQNIGQRLGTKAGNAEDTHLEDQRRVRHGRRASCIFRPTSAFLTTRMAEACSFFNLLFLPRKAFPLEETGGALVTAGR